MKHLRTWFLFIPTLVVVFCASYTTLHAAFVPLVPIPQINYDQPDFARFIETAYIIAVVVAAFIGVGKLILSGFKYVTSSVVTDKTDAKKDILQVFIGLLIVLGAVAILRTISPTVARLPGLEPISVFEEKRVEVRTGAGVYGGDLADLSFDACRFGDTACIATCAKTSPSAIRGVLKCEKAADGKNITFCTADPVITPGARAGGTRYNFTKCEAQCIEKPGGTTTQKTIDTLVCSSDSP